MQRTASKSILTRAKRPPSKKTVSFCSEDECRVYRADDYDRTAVAPSRDLSTRDYQELEEVLNVTTAPRERVMGGRVHMPLLPLLQDDAPRSPPAASQPPPKFPSAPSRIAAQPPRKSILQRPDPGCERQIDFFVTVSILGRKKSCKSREFAVQN